MYYKQVEDELRGKTFGSVLYTLQSSCARHLHVCTVYQLIANFYSRYGNLVRRCALLANRL